MPERAEVWEFSGEEIELINKLKTLGPDNPEAREALLAWTQAGEARANEVNTSRANIEFNIMRAKLYRAAGFTEEAWDVLESVRTQSQSENEMDLYELAMRMMDEIDADI